MSDEIRLSPTLEKRFWPKVDRRGPDDCWEWHGSKVRGYGQLGNGAKGTLLATRISWWIATDAWPGKLFVLHRCDNPACVNPAHLFLGTQKDNMADCAKKGRNTRGRRLDTTRTPRGTQHYLTKLCDDDVRAIRRLYESGVRVSELQSRFQLSGRGVYKIINRETWAHVTD